MEIHRKVADKEPGIEERLDEIIEKHFYLPYASLQVREDMRKSADRSIKDYFHANQADFDKIRFIEKDIEMNLGNGVRIRGRMDLVKRKDLGGEEKTLIVDFKTEHREITENITEEQLNIYALGYNSLTGKDADYIEVYNLDNNESSRKSVGKENLMNTREFILGAANDIMGNRLNKHCHKEKCKGCYLNYLCLTKEKKKEFSI
jgi:DNA helicase-2/ATP-dependent DNA helicase PcrA